jgi:hypothetical protein
MLRDSQFLRGFMNTVDEALTRWKYQNAIGKNLTDVFAIINAQMRDHQEIFVIIAM